MPEGTPLFRSKETERKLNAADLMIYNAENQCVLVAFWRLGFRRNRNNSNVFLESLLQSVSIRKLPVAAMV